MKLLSIRQPWASLIAAGVKEYETRSWRTDYRGTIAIHAASTWTRQQRAYVQDLDRLADAMPGLGLDAVLDAHDDHHELDYGFPRGAIIAIGTLAGVIETTDITPTPLERALGDWTPGRFAFRMGNIERLDAPVPMVGRLGLRDVSQHTAELVLSRVPQVKGR